MSPLDGKVPGRSYYQSFYPPRLHSLTLCQTRCKDAHKRGTMKSKASCRTFLSKAPANNFQQCQCPHLDTVFLPQPAGIRSRGAEGRREVNWPLFLQLQEGLFSPSVNSPVWTTHSHSQSPDHQVSIPKGGVF